MKLTSPGSYDGLKRRTQKSQGRLRQAQKARDAQARVTDSYRSSFSEHLDKGMAVVDRIEDRHRLQRVARYAGLSGPALMLGGAILAQSKPLVGAGLALSAGVATATAVWAVGFGPLRGSAIESLQSDALVKLKVAQWAQETGRQEEQTLYELEVKLHEARVEHHQNELVLARVNRSAEEVRRMAEQVRQLEATEVTFAEDSLLVGDFDLPRF